MSIVTQETMEFLYERLLVTPRRLRSSSRCYHLSRSRWLAAKLLRRIGATWTEAARMVGLKSHQPLIRGCRLVDKDQALSDMYKMLEGQYFQSNGRNQNQ